MIVPAGFFVTLALGVICLVVAAVGASATFRHSRLFKLVFILLFAAAGAALVYFSTQHAPFTITVG